MPQPETERLVAVLAALKTHPRVAYAKRQNTGGAYLGEPARYVAFGDPGDPDITGMLRGGRRLEVEVKCPGEWPSEETFSRWHRGEGFRGQPFRLTDDKKRLLAQHAHLQATNAGGGLGFVAYGPEDVYRELGDVDAARAHLEHDAGDDGRAYRQALLQAASSRRGGRRRGRNRWMVAPGEVE